MLVVVAARRGTVALASAELRAWGASEIEQRAVAPDQVLLYAGSFDDAPAARLTAALRSGGWAAAVRPVAGGHLTAWQTHTRPIKIGDQLWVCFPWSEFDRSEAPAVVEIDPGPAFGTGAHPSSRLLLTELAERLGGGEHVLDVGCGSGVLAVAAARLGAASVTALDLEPHAVAATRANAARNGLEARVHPSATPVSQVSGRFDVIVANIGAAALIELAPALQCRLAPEGWIGLSGLSPAQVSVVASSYGRLRTVSVPADDDWVAWVARRDARSMRRHR